MAALQGQARNFPQESLGGEEISSGPVARHAEPGYAAASSGPDGAAAQGYRSRSLLEFSQPPAVALGRSRPRGSDLRQVHRHGVLPLCPGGDPHPAPGPLPVDQGFLQPDHGGFDPADQALDHDYGRGGNHVVGRLGARRIVQEVEGVRASDLVLYRNGEQLADVHVEARPRAALGKIEGEEAILFAAANFRERLKRRREHVLRPWPSAFLDGAQ
ncbi:MAG: hypothetical protein A2001_04380 [Treponema sp. GWC1_61_84]|nr:MAG: hypothetical protein A2001_04380 [Treponema sp. GWC1_61_84]